ncbi:MAG: Methyltransferase type 12 [uncultured bacterium]|nr:MAG: Methyltransferase type 12 [uncultured bacterium]HBR71551.1 class I SAM-dependent methyltransferase [Candidatus Moranbacteria bacterium]
MELYENSYNKENHFSFGKNWQNFLKTLTQEKIEEAKKSLIIFLGGKDKIKDKTFIDIGCGSGLFSLAAYLLGASEIVSVDVDDFSIACTQYLKKEHGNPLNWKIVKGSALNKNFITTLGQFDIVYSWGVLHHSGDMYKAFANIINLVKQEGLFYLAIYNENINEKKEGTSKLWLKIKEFYNKSNFLIKKIMLSIYIFWFISGLIFSGKNPYKYIKNYKSNRGMNWINDLIDWIGGYPYEYASITTITNYFKKEGFSCINISPARSIGCNEFLLKKLA